MGRATLLCAPFVLLAGHVKPWGAEKKTVGRLEPKAWLERPAFLPLGLGVSFAHTTFRFILLASLFMFQIVVPLKLSIYALTGVGRACLVVVTGRNS